MVSILFWNLDKRPGVLAHAPCLASHYGVDVFAFAECPADVRPALRALNALGVGTYTEAGAVRAKVRVLSRLPPADFGHRFTTLGRVAAVWSIRAPKLNPQEVLLAAMHLPSKAGGNTKPSQAADAGLVAAELAAFEDTRSHRHTVFVGDFNMNPYDPGMTLVTGVHGLMTRPLADLPDRLHLGRHFRRLYNPMWGLFGDRTAGPAGTYYWRSSVIENTHWAMLDQVLLRPALAGRLHDLRILESDGAHGLCGADGAPDKAHLSDHLPILFRLDI